MAILVIPVIEAETDQGTGFFPFLNTKLPAHPSLGIGVGIFGAKIVKVEYVLFVADFFACHANQDVVRPFFPSLFDDSCLNFPARYWCSGGCNEVGKSLTGIWYRIFLTIHIQQSTANLIIIALCINNGNCYHVYNFRYT